MAWEEHQKILLTSTNNSALQVPVTNAILHHTVTNMKIGAYVFRSKENAALNSFRGVHEGGTNLAQEVRHLASTGRFQDISFVGNSLGGVYARYAIQLLYNASDGLVAGLTPSKLLLIASPSLGVRNFTIVDDKDIWVPDILKRTISYTLRKSGKDLFCTDASSFTDTLLYKMAHEEVFLAPLRAFKQRRLYANLENDFVVPLGTSALLDKAQVKGLREKHGASRGIVASLVTEPQDFIVAAGEDPLLSMMRSLNALGWEKQIVHFPGLLPIAHNKICALNRPVYWLLNGVFAEGRFVMDHASEWLCPCGSNYAVESAEAA